MYVPTLSLCNISLLAVTLYPWTIMYKTGLRVIIILPGCSTITQQKSWSSCPSCLSTLSALYRFSLSVVTQLMSMCSLTLATRPSLWLSLPHSGGTFHAVVDKKWQMKSDLTRLKKKLQLSELLINNYTVSLFVLNFSSSARLPVKLFCSRNMPNSDRWGSVIVLFQ